MSTATITLQPDDIAEMIATCIGDGIAWLIRWTLVILFSITRSTLGLLIAIVRWLWFVALPYSRYYVILWGIYVMFGWRVSVALGLGIYRWWKYRDLCRYADGDGDFITTTYAAVTI